LIGRDEAIGFASLWGVVAGFLANLRWSRRLRDCLAGPAGELLAHVLDYFPLARDELQRADLEEDDSQAEAAARITAATGETITVGDNPAIKIN
jgi:ABC-type Fe3+ transport system permease subunit